MHIGDITFSYSALIKSVDGGLTWKPALGYDKLDLFKYEIKWPTWTNRITRGTTNDIYSKQSGINALKY